MAKASTSKDRRLAARSRAARASSAQGASVPADDEALREEEIDPAGDTMMDEEAEQFAEQQEAADAGNELPAAFSSERSLTSTADRAALRTYTVPAWTLGNPITRFIAESYIELRKVTWPTWNEAWNWTLVVIAMSAVIAIILAAADFGLTHLLTWIVSLSTAK